jgi:hypothetical protein
MSSVCSVVGDVPQDGVLGPVLTIIYVNDITNLWPSNTVSIKIFADDTKLYTVTPVLFYKTILRSLLI